VFARLHRAYPDLHITIEDVIAKGDKVVIGDSVTGPHRGRNMGIPSTGKSVTYNEILIARIVNGLIAQTWGVVADAAVGVLPPRGVASVNSPREVSRW
jgi:predicted ester cyclase